MERALRVIPLIPLLLLIAGFWGEISVVSRRLFRWYVWGDVTKPAGYAQALPIDVTIILCFIIFFLFWLRIVSAQTIFPVTRRRHVVLTALYLILHILGRHGLAAYARNGRIKAYVDELQSRRPGAVVVDFNSAIAVEQIVLPRGLRRRVTDIVRGFLSLAGITLPSIRIQGSGLIFTLPDERIHGVNDLDSPVLVSNDPAWMERILGVVDLRTQFRISVSRPHPLSKRLGSPVLAYTRDGIEVKTNIWALATLGHDPAPFFPLTVTYVGDRQPINLQVVRLQAVPDRPDVFRVESLTNDLDEADRFEIHQRWQTLAVWVPFEAAPPPAITPSFNFDRIFAAVYGRARLRRGLGSIDEMVPWVDLPVHVGIDLFREFISQYNYDEIYRPRLNAPMGIAEIRARLASAMRNSGLVACRPVFHSGGRILQEGGEYLASELLTVPVANAILPQNRKVLRDRGIRVIASGFGDLVVDERIYKQYLDHWRANWDRETEIVEAGLEWESLKVRTRARIQAQQDFVQSLAQIYQTNTNSREILAMRVLQALEMAATDSKTRQLLPEDTFSMLRSIHDWLLPQDMGYGADT